jgi:hypothetical protein
MGAKCEGSNRLLFCVCQHEGSLYMRRGVAIPGVLSFDSVLRTNFRNSSRTGTVIRDGRMGNQNGNAYTLEETSFCN